MLWINHLIKGWREDVYITPIPRRISWKRKTVPHHAVAPNPGCAAANMHLQVGQLRSAGDDDSASVSAEVTAPQQVWDMAVVGQDNGQRGVDMVATSSVWRWKSVVDDSY